MSEAKDYHVIEISYGITYKTEKPVPIDKIVESLVNLEKVLKRTGPFVEAAFDGVKVHDIQVFVKELHEGSLVQDLVVRYVLGGQENAARLKETLTKIMDDSTPMRSVVLIGAGALLMYGAMSALPPGTPTKSIKAHQSVIIEAGGDVNISAEKIHELLEATRDKKSLAKESIGALSPSKYENAPIIFEGAPAISIPSQVMQEVPESYEPPTPEEKDERYKNAKVLISASDRDHLDKGWAGVVPGVADKRTKIALDEAVNPKDLHGRVQVQADITVTMRFIKSRKVYEPTLITIDRIH